MVLQLDGRMRVRFPLRLFTNMTNSVKKSVSALLRNVVKMRGRMPDRVFGIVPLPREGKGRRGKPSTVLRCMSSYAGIRYRTSGNRNRRPR